MHDGGVCRQRCVQFVHSDGLWKTIWYGTWVAGSVCLPQCWVSLFVAVFFFSSFFLYMQPRAPPAARTCTRIATALPLRAFNQKAIPLVSHRGRDRRSLGNSREFLSSNMTAHFAFSTPQNSSPSSQHLRNQRRPPANYEDYRAPYKTSPKLLAHIAPRSPLLYRDRYPCPALTTNGASRSIRHVGKNEREEKTKRVPNPIPPPPLTGTQPCILYDPGNFSSGHDARPKKKISMCLRQVDR